MILVVNGERQEAEPGLTLASLLDRLGLPRTGIAVERNREIVPKSVYAVTELTDGDRLEIVQFVGGG